MLTNLKYLNWHHFQSYCTLGTVGLALHDFQSLFDLGPAAMTSWIPLQGRVVFATQRFRLPQNFTIFSGTCIKGNLKSNGHLELLKVQWQLSSLLCSLYWIRKRWEWRWNWWNCRSSFPFEALGGSHHGDIHWWQRALRAVDRGATSWELLGAVGVVDVKATPATAATDRTLFEMKQNADHFNLVAGPLF